MTIFLFSLQCYDFWPVLMAHLLLHDFLHLFIYDAAKTVRPLTSYSTKNSNSGTVLKRNKVRLDTHFNPAAPQTLHVIVGGENYDTSLINGHSGTSEFIHIGMVWLQ
jgi:hypothetical protein